MALFKIFRGAVANLESVPKTDGHAYFCRDNGGFYIDYEDDNGELQRKQVNQGDLEALGYKIDNIDYNNIKNTPTWMVEDLITMSSGEFTSMPIDEFNGLYLIIPTITENVDPNKVTGIDLILDSQFYMYKMTDFVWLEALGLHFAGNLSKLNIILGTDFPDTGEPFVLGTTGTEHFIGTDFFQSTTHRINISAIVENVEWSNAQKHWFEDNFVTVNDPNGKNQQEIYGNKYFYGELVHDKSGRLIAERDIQNFLTKGENVTLTFNKDISWAEVKEAQKDLAGCAIVFSQELFFDIDSEGYAANFYGKDLFVSSGGYRLWIDGIYSPPSLYLIYPSGGKYTIYDFNSHTVYMDDFICPADFGYITEFSLGDNGTSTATYLDNYISIKWNADVTITIGDTTTPFVEVGDKLATQSWVQAQVPEVDTSNLVDLTSNQTIDGNKHFKQPIKINSETAPQEINIYDNYVEIQDGWPDDGMAGYRTQYFSNKIVRGSAAGDTVLRFPNEEGGVEGTIATQEFIDGQGFVTSSKVEEEGFHRVDNINWTDLIGQDLSGRTVYFDTTQGYMSAGSYAVTVLMRTDAGYDIYVGGPPYLWLRLNGYEDTLLAYPDPGLESWVGVNPDGSYVLPDDFGTVIEVGCPQALNIYCPSVELFTQIKEVRMNVQDIDLIVPNSNNETIATQEWVNKQDFGVDTSIDYEWTGLNSFRHKITLGDVENAGMYPNVSILTIDNFKFSQIDQYQTRNVHFQFPSNDGLNANRMYTIATQEYITDKGFASLEYVNNQGYIRSGDQANLLQLNVAQYITANEYGANNSTFQDGKILYGWTDNGLKYADLCFPKEEGTQTLATQAYVTSVYEERIAELEAKIAALEALLPEIVRL